MKTIVVMFDSLNRHLLQPYGCSWTHTPNFQRLAQRSVTFDRSYVCSMPCMPARRDMHTGRPHFLHRNWGPLEPFDDSMPALLRDAGVYTHLATDHFHYFEDGGCTYHNRYSSWEFFRGQEGDHWIPQVAHEPPAARAAGQNAAAHAAQTHDRVNRKAMPHAYQQPQARTFAAGLEFLERNSQEDNWMLQIETFDPHEPFFAHRSFRDRFPEHYLSYAGPECDWPAYGRMSDTPPEVLEHLRFEYASLLNMCDSKLGDVLDAMDRLNLWEDTMLIVMTDHGFMLGEHEWWAKMVMPMYEEISHTPFFVWDPRSRRKGERCSALVQPAIDLAPTMLKFFGKEVPPDMLGRDLAPAIASDTPVRQAAMFGMYGAQMNVTDGRYVYMRAPEPTAPIHEYTLMPTHMRGFWSSDGMKDVALTGPLSFTKNYQVLRAAHTPEPAAALQETLLFDLKNDPRELQPLRDEAVEQKMINYMVQLMKACDAPAEQYRRYGLAPTRS